MRKILILISFFVLPRIAFASFKFTPNCVKAYREVIHLNFIKAQQILEAEKKSDPKNLIPEYIESYIDFLTAFISEEERDFKTLKEKHSQRLDLFDKGDEHSPWFLLTKAEIHLQTAIVKIKFEEYITAAYEFRKGYKLLENNKKKFPDFVPNKKCLGLLHALIGAVPSNYKWLTSILGFHGTIPQGIGELRELLNISENSSAYQYLHDETIIILLFFEFHLLKNSQSAMELAKQIETSEMGPLHLFAVNSIYIYSARNERTIELTSSRKKSTGEFPLYYLDFMLGTARLNKLHFDAEKDFKIYVDNFKGNSFVKSAYQKLAWIDLLQGDTTGYFENMKSVLQKGNDFTDEDKQAINEARSNEVPNICLLRSRLLFDGGYYDAAIDEIAGKPVSYFPKFRDQLEMPYRLARIYDKQGQKEKAIIYYEKTIKNGESYPFYFAANSALYEGLVYENLFDTVNASRCYKKCLSMRNHEFQNSIDQKAEAGLNRLGVEN